MHHYPLLCLLADGSLHSGSELARELGISRTAVWKQLQHLEGQGLDVQTVRGHGYRLTDPLDLLQRERILGMIPVSVADRVSLDVRSDVGSTNQSLLARPALASDYEVCLAERQTEGRGRRGRAWDSPFAQNLYLSIAFETDGAMEAVQGITLVAGVAVAEALESLGVTGVGLKWPNDVWLNGQKVAGILSELQGTVQDRFRLVIGIGLNVYMTEAGVDQPWTSLGREQQVPVEGRNRIAAALVSHLVHWLHGAQGIQSQAFQKVWRDHDTLAGQPIHVHGADLRGIAQGIDETGMLRIMTDSGIEHRVNAGEVSVRVSGQ